MLLDKKKCMSLSKEDLADSESLSTILRPMALSQCLSRTLFVVLISLSVQYVGINLEDRLRSKRAGASGIVKAGKTGRRPSARRGDSFPNR